MVVVSMRRRRGRGATVLLVTVCAAAVLGCTTGRAFQQGNQAALKLDWDLAVTYYEQAVQGDPSRAEFKMALQRAQISAAQVHLEKARELERRDQLDMALLEYRRVVEFHAVNQEARARIQAIEQILRDRIEAARPKSPADGMRQKARQAMEEPALNPASREPVQLKMLNRQLQEVLDFLGASTGINIAYDKDFQKNTVVNVNMDGVTLEEALHQILTVNGAYYKVLNPRSIIIIADIPGKRTAYDEQAVQTFYLSSADPADMEQLLTKVVASSTQGVRPTFAANKAANSITVRGTAPMLQLVERVIAMNDRPRAEISIDVEILEINRGRAKQYGLELSEYQIGFAMSPETRPGGTNTDTSFNLNTVSRGVNTTDFYTSVPQAVVKFLESDSTTKVLAKPNLRGSEGEKLSLKLGEEIPVPNTTFYNPYGGSGGVATTPLTSFTYKNVGVNVDIEPRVTFEGDVIMKLAVEISAKGQDVNVAGQNLPSFLSRKVEGRMRLRDGESNLLAGLLREQERRSLKGFPGILRLPVVKQLFSSNDHEILQTDIVMLLTPHIVRTHEMTQKDFSPVFIGTQQNLGLTGPPPLIQPPGEAAPAVPPQRPPAATTAAQAPASPTATPASPTAAPASLTAAPASPTATPASPTPSTGATVPAVQRPPTVPVPGQAAAPAQVNPPAIPAAAAPTPPPAATAPAPPPAAAAAAQTPAAPGAAGQPVPGESLRILLTTPAAPVMVAGPAVTVPISVSGASKISTVTLSLRFDPRVLRVRLVQQGTFLSMGGVAVTFAQQIDAVGGRLDVTLTRTSDTTGASGDGLLAAVVFDTIGAGVSQLGLGGVVTGPGGLPIPVQLVPASITVR